MGLGFKAQSEDYFEDNFNMYFLRFFQIFKSHLLLTHISHFSQHLAFLTYFENSCAFLIHHDQPFSSINNYDFVLMKCPFGVNVEMAKP